jgi:uncharacterized protein YjiS (DUF1127 family)
MEMIMIAFSNTASRDGGIATGIFGSLAAAAARWWSGYVDRRVERTAIALLQSMSDRQLKDIGLARGQIEYVVRHGRDIDRVVGCRL